MNVVPKTENFRGDIHTQVATRNGHWPFVGGWVFFQTVFTWHIFYSKSNYIIFSPESLNTSSNSLERVLLGCTRHHSSPFISCTYDLLILEKFGSGFFKGPGSGFSQGSRVWFFSGSRSGPGLVF